MASPPPSPPPAIIGRLPDTVRSVSTEDSFMKELRDRISKRVAKGIGRPVPGLRRLQQQQLQGVTFNEGIHTTDSDVQSGQSPCTVDTLQQVSQEQTWDIKFRTHASVHRCSLDGAEDECTPEWRKQCMPGDLQSSRTSVQARASVIRVPETTTIDHAEASSTRGAIVDKLEADLLRVVQKSSRHFWKRPMVKDKYAERSEPSISGTSCHTENSKATDSRTFKDTRNPEKKDLTFLGATEMSDKVAQDWNNGQSQGEQDDSGSFSSSNKTINAGVPLSSTDMANKAFKEKVVQQRTGILPRRGSDMKTLPTDVTRKLKNNSVGLTTLTGTNGVDSEKRKGKLEISSKDGATTKSSGSKDQKKRKQRSNQEPGALTTGDLVAASNRPQQTSLYKCPNPGAMDESDIAASKKYLQKSADKCPTRIRRNRDSDIQNVVQKVLKTLSKNISIPHSKKSTNVKRASGTTLPGSNTLDLKKSISDRIPHPRKRATEFRQPLDIKGKPFAEVLADIEDEDSSKTEATTTHAVTTMENNSKMYTDIGNTAMDNKKPTTSRRDLRNTKALVADEINLRYKKLLSIPIKPVLLPSDEGSKETALHLHPFCTSEALVASESISLSFMSSDSSCNDECEMTLRPTDIEDSSGPITPEALTKEPGDGKSPVRGARQVSTTDVSRMSQSVQVGHSKHRKDTAPLNTNERQLSVDSEYFRNENLLRVLLMGNQHYIREKTASFQRPTRTLASTVNKTQYVWNQIIYSPTPGAQTPVRPFSLPSDLTARGSPKPVKYDDIFATKTSGPWEKSPSCEDESKGRRLYEDPKLKKRVLLNNPPVDLTKPEMPKRHTRSNAYFREWTPPPTELERPAFPVSHGSDSAKGGHEVQKGPGTTTQVHQPGVVSTRPTGNTLIPLSTTGVLNTRFDMQTHFSSAATPQQTHVEGPSQVTFFNTNLLPSGPSPVSTLREFILAEDPHASAPIGLYSTEDTSAPNVDGAASATLACSRNTIESSRFSKLLSLSTRTHGQPPTRIPLGTCHESMHNPILQVQSSLTPDTVQITTVSNSAVPLPSSFNVGMHASMLMVIPSDESDTITRQPSDTPSLFNNRRATQSERKSLFKHRGVVSKQQPQKRRQSRLKMVPLVRPCILKTLRTSVPRYASCRLFSSAPLLHKPLSQLEVNPPPKRVEKSSTIMYQKPEAVQEPTRSNQSDPLAFRAPDTTDPTDNDGQSFYSDGSMTESESSLLPDSTKLNWSDDEEDD